MCDKNILKKDFERDPALEIKTLLIIAGVSCVGKSLLIEKMKQNMMFEHLPNLKISSTAQYIDSGFLKRSLPNLYADEVIIHFDFMHHALVHQAGFQALSTLMKYSQKITVLSLCSSSQLISQRHYLRLQETLKQATPEQKDQLFFNYHVLYFRYKQTIFENPTQVSNYYVKWADFLSSTHTPENHFLLDSEQYGLKWLGAYHNDKVKTILSREPIQ